MKTNKLITLCTLFGLFAVAYSCKKIDIPNSNQISVYMYANSAGYITSDTTLNPGATFSLQYAITSPVDMEYVYVYKNGTEVTKTQVLTSKKWFTTSTTYTADTSPGVYTYRIVAKDKAGIYLGEKNIVVKITSDFNYFVNRTIFVPDTVDQTNPTYFATTTNKVLSYSTVGAESATIDFGYFYDPTLTSGVANGHTLYALNITPVPTPLSVNNITNYTKNATLLKIITSPTFANVTSSATLASAATSNMGSGTATSVKGLTAGKLVMFKTAAGKYGIINVNYTNQNSAAKGTFMNIDVKVQR
ncbi:MAG: hypothetical protein ACKOW2_05510 [Sphingobacteriaceae bacterium]